MQNHCVGVIFKTMTTSHYRFIMFNGPRECKYNEHLIKLRQLFPYFKQYKVANFFRIKYSKNLFRKKILKKFYKLFPDSMSFRIRRGKMVDLVFLVLLVHLVIILHYLIINI